MSNPRIKDFSIMETRADTLAFLEKRLEYSGGNPIYIGYNQQPNADTAASTWYIVKLTYSGSDLTYYQLPASGPMFNYAWDDRATFFP